MAMRYDVRTGRVEPDEPRAGASQVPGWPHLSRPGPGQGYYYDLRIGDAERDTAMDQLREHFAAGRLTFDELAERIDGALTAKTQGQIELLMADLPRTRKPAVPATQVADDAQDTGRYIVLLLLLFALAAWLLMMAWMASRAPMY
jgi:Domain of unknown function (DUF1707)